MGLEIEFNRLAASPPEEKSLRDLLERLRARPGIRVHHLHHHCFVAGELERTKVDGAPERRLST